MQTATRELRNSTTFEKLLEVVLKTGNRLNMGTYRGGATAFKLDSLLKLSDVKGVDGKTTLLQFVVQEIMRKEAAAVAGDNLPDSTPSTPVGPPTPGLQGGGSGRSNSSNHMSSNVVLNLQSELANVKKAAILDADNLKSCGQKLVNGCEQIKLLLQQISDNSTSQNGDADLSYDPADDVFNKNMTAFVEQVGSEVAKLADDLNLAFEGAKRTNRYFNGQSPNDDKQPLKVFQVVSSFLVILEQVCKNVMPPPTKS